MTAPFRVSILLEGKDQGARAAVKGVGDEARRTDKATDQLGGTVAGAGKRSAKSANDMKMLAYQLNQVGQQGAVTGNYMQALMIQLPDVLAVAGGLPGVIAGGVIAITAGLVPGLMSGSSASRDFTDDIDDLTEAIGSYREYADLAASDTDDLAERFGNAAGRASQAAEILSEWARIEALEQLDQSVESLTERFGGLDAEMLVALDTSRGFFASWFDTGTPIGYVTELENTVRTLRQELDLTEPQANAVAGALADLAAADTVQAQVDAAVALDAQFKAVFGSVENIPPELREVAKQAALIALRAVELGEEFENAADAVWDIDEALSSVIAGINGATTSAEALELAFLNAAGAASTISLPAPPDVTVTPLAPPAETVGGYSMGSWASGYRSLAAYYNRPPVKSSTRRGGGGAAEEADAVQELIDSLEAELELARELDPVQQQMIEHREALAEATDAERAQVESLIVQIEAEQRARERATEVAEVFNQTVYDGLTGFQFEGDSVIDMIENMTRALAEAAWQAALLGEGGLGKLFGMDEGGGALGMISDALVSALTGDAAAEKAEGGMIWGRGGGTDDRVPIWASTGEFIMPAGPTARYRDLLERIRAGADVPHMATGGVVGGGVPGGMTFAPRFEIINTSSAQIDGKVEETTGPGGERAFRMVLADQVGAALTQPGGGAAKVMRAQYGMSPMGVRR